MAAWNAASQEPTQRQEKATPEASAEKQVRREPTNQNICDRSPKIQKTLLTTLQLKQCSSVTEQELFRIEGLTIDTKLKSGDLDNLVNLKTLKIQIQEEPPPAGILADMESLETLYIYGRADEPWDIRGILTGATKLRSLRMESGPQELTIEEGDFTGLQNLEEININGVGSLEGKIFNGLKNLKSVTLESGRYYSDPKKNPTLLPGETFINSPGVQGWTIRDIIFPGKMPVASIRQLCTTGVPRNSTNYYINGERVTLIGINGSICKIATGEPWPDGN